MRAQKRTKQEKTIRFPVEAHFSGDGEMTLHYEDVPISAYNKWVEYIASGLALSYYSQENIRKMEEERWKQEAAQE